MDGGSGSSGEDVTSSSDEEGETVRCTACGRGNRAHEMVLCEHCDRGVHIDCRSPPMAAVPEHDFYCAACCAKAGHPDSSDGALPEAGQVQLVEGGSGHTLSTYLALKCRWEAHTFLDAIWAQPLPHNSADIS